MIHALKYCIITILLTMLVVFLTRKIPLGLSSLEQPQNVVRVRSEHGNEIEHGSGVLIHPNLVLTAHHVIRDAGIVVIEFKGGLVKECEIIKTSKKWDLALLKFDSVLYTPARPAEKVTRGELVTICGFPDASDYDEVRGKIIGFVSPDRKSKSYLFKVNNRCESGMSGGPVFNSNNEVVGIVFGTRRSAYCTGLDALEDFLHEQPSKQNDFSENN